MIKPTDLRIGNMVEYNNQFDPKEIIDISIITSEGVTDSNNMIEFVYNGLYAIPLTEDWLKDFGFSSLDNDTHELEDFTLVWQNGYYATNGGIELISGVELKYVHQLQNFYYAITGKELNRKSQGN